jgi:predicted transcriptional regulator
MEALVAARNKSGIAHQELARRPGQSDSFIGKIEGGKRQLSVLEFCELADALDPRSLFAKTVE